MPESGLSSEEVAHDDLCPVSLAAQPPSRLQRSQNIDMPAVAFHTCAHAMQPPALCIMYGPMGRCVIDEPN
jgi:hypothetical protein